MIRIIYIVFHHSLISLTFYSLIYIRYVEWNAPAAQQPKYKSLEREAQQNRLRLWHNYVAPVTTAAAATTNNTNNATAAASPSQSSSASTTSTSAVANASQNVVVGGEGAAAAAAANKNEKLVLKAPPIVPTEGTLTFCLSV